MKTFFKVILAIVLFPTLYFVICFMLSLVIQMNPFEIMKMEGLAAGWILFGSIGCLELADNMVETFYNKNNSQGAL
jgi:hypothetical protein